jgi:hypothetical protein
MYDYDDIVISRIERGRWSDELGKFDMKPAIEIALGDVYDEDDFDAIESVSVTLDEAELLIKRLKKAVKEGRNK